MTSCIRGFVDSLQGDVLPLKVSCFIKPALFFGNKVQLCDHNNTYSCIEGNYEFIVVVAKVSLPRKVKRTVDTFLQQIEGDDFNLGSVSNLTRSSFFRRGRNDAIAIAWLAK